MTSQEFHMLALSFPGTEESPHFDRIAFKTQYGIFTTLHVSKAQANFKLSTTEQSVFCDYNKFVFPVPNKWGLHGWTTVDLPKTEEALIKAILTSAYEESMAKKTKK